MVSKLNSTNSLLQFKLTPFQGIVFVYGVIAVIFIFQLGLTEQEAYYWLWAKNPDWSYFDHPPLQAWVTAILTFLFGDEKWVVRLPALGGAFYVLWLFYKWTKMKWGKQTAEICCLFLIASSVFTAGSVIALPDSLAVPFGLTALYYAEKGFVRRTAVFLGLALLGKWTVVFIVPGIAYFLYKQNKFRIQSISQIFLIVLFFQIPVIWWNFQHGSVSAKFHLYSRHTHDWLSLKNYAENIFQYFLAQFFALGLLTTLFLVILLTKKNILKNIQKPFFQTLIFWVFPGLFVVFISAAQGQIRFYWTFISLLPVIAITGYLTAQHFQDRLVLVQRLAITAILFQWSCAALIGFLPIGPAVESAFHLKTDLRHSPIGEFSGWSQWYQETLLPTKLLDADTALIGSDLHVAARLSWTVRKNISLDSIGVAGGNKNQFQFWPQPSPPRFKKAVFFADNRYDRVSNFDEACNHPVKWKTTPSTLLNRPIKEIYWAFCSSLKN